MEHLALMNSQSEQVKAIAEKIRSVLGERSDIAAVYLLGSAAKGRLRKDSDIDLALLPVADSEITVQNRLELAGVLEGVFCRPIDIGVITTQNLVYASEAILNGYRIVTINNEFAENMEMRLLGCYLTFKQDRKNVEKSYGKR